MIRWPLDDQMTTSWPDDHWLSRSPLDDQMTTGWPGDHQMTTGWLGDHWMTRWPLDDQMTTWWLKSTRLLQDFSGSLQVYQATGGLLRFASGPPGYMNTSQVCFSSTRLLEDFSGSLQVHQATLGLLRLASGQPGYWKTSLWVHFTWSRHWPMWLESSEPRWSKQPGTFPAFCKYQTFLLYIVLVVQFFLCDKLFRLSLKTMVPVESTSL